jgi:hypothetical protein
MLRRTALRRSLMALLYSDEVSQGACCEYGPLWTGCDNRPIDILDSETSQLFPEVDGTFELAQEDAIICFYFQRVDYELSQAKVENVELNLQIDIVANAASPARRQDILDTIEERILYRLLSAATFTDATLGIDLPVITRLLKRNGLSIRTLEDSNFRGKYTYRSLSMTLNSDECIKKGGCDDVPLCIDLTIIPDLETVCGRLAVPHDHPLN